MIEQEHQALKQIAELLPTGYVKSVPYSIRKDVSFEFNGVTVKMSALYLNEPLNCYMFDLAWEPRIKYSESLFDAVSIFLSNTRLRFQTCMQLTQYSLVKK